MKLPVEVEDIILRLIVHHEKQQVHQQLLKRRPYNGLFEGYDTGMRQVVRGLATPGYQNYTACHKQLYYTTADDAFCVAKNCLYTTVPVDVWLTEHGVVGVRDMFYVRLRDTNKRT